MTPPEMPSGDTSWTSCFGAPLETILEIESRASCVSVLAPRGAIYWVFSRPSTACSSYGFGSRGSTGGLSPPLARALPSQPWSMPMQVVTV
ncbi:Uncharacterized protein HZ326_10332 [Fusarium oxysporum f. sp. albedinis]|nr:Uncharacterized protein HZ326_10332 [Fusarium oxysporum f. sp. albedinis]